MGDKTTLVTASAFTPMRLKRLVTFVAFGICFGLAVCGEHSLARAQAVAPTTVPSSPPSGETSPSSPIVPSPPAASAGDRQPQDAPQAGQATPREIGPVAHDMSPMSMFLGADIVVKSVILGLTIASLMTWTILIAKIFEFGQAQRRINRAITRLGRCKTLADAEQLFPSGRRDVVAKLVHESVDEARLSAGVGPGGGVRDRAMARCTEVVRDEGRRLRIGTGMLATIGSTAPFVGLFGTVWGIMNSFVGIAKAQTTNLAVVAPGIAEALFATAIGLVAAIPAVIIYNHFARVTRNHLERVNRASGIILRLLSRDLDHARGSHAAATGD